MIKLRVYCCSSVEGKVYIFYVRIYNDGSQLQKAIYNKNAEMERKAWPEYTNRKFTSLTLLKYPQTMKNEKLLQAMRECTWQFVKSRFFQQICCLCHALGKYRHKSVASITLFVLLSQSIKNGVYPLAFCEWNISNSLCNVQNL